MVPRFNDVLYVSGGAQALSTADAKAHMRVTAAAEDTLIGDYCLSAQRELEEMTALVLSTATWRIHLDQFPADRCIVVPRGPLQSLTAIDYTKEGGGAGTVPTTDLHVVTGSMPGYLELIQAASWPSDGRWPWADVRITIVLGYATLPDVWKHALRVLVATKSEQREDHDERKTATAIRSIVRNHGFV